MADTTAASGLTPQQWDAKFFTEHVKQNRFNSVMGTGVNSIIQVKNDLTSKKGDSVTFALVNRLTQDATTGDNTLEGNEESLTSRSQKVTTAQLRHGVRVSTTQEQFSAIGLRNAARDSLKTWVMENLRDAIIDELTSINGTAIGSASETNKDAWLVDNADRVLFGAAVSNNSSNDHSASLANIDNSADKLTPAAISLMKRIAGTASPKIRPVLTTEDTENYVLYCNPLVFRDIGLDSTMVQANREARARGIKNPLFRGGDLLWDGVVIKEITDIATISSNIQVAPALLCGAQAIALAWTQRTKTVTEEFDYGDKHGVAISQFRGIEKLTFGSGSGDTDDLKDNGIVTGFFAAVAD